MAAILETANLFCFLNTITWNLSKSERLALLCLTANFLAQEVAAHLLSMSAAAHFLLTVAVLAPLGNFSKTRGVNTTLFKEMACLLMDGPSINTWRLVLCLRGRYRGGTLGSVGDFGNWMFLGGKWEFRNKNGTVGLGSARGTQWCGQLLDIGENGRFRWALHTLFWSMISTMVANLELLINTIRPYSTYLQLAVSTVVDMIRVWKKLENLENRLL